MKTTDVNVNGTWYTPGTDRRAVQDIAVALAKLMTTEQIADILQTTLSCEADPRLSDCEVALIETLFDKLAEDEEAIAIATGADTENDLQFLGR